MDTPYVHVDQPAAILLLTGIRVIGGQGGETGRAFAPIGEIARLVIPHHGTTDIRGEQRTAHLVGVEIGQHPVLALGDALPIETVGLGDEVIPPGDGAPLHLPAQVVGGGGGKGAPVAVLVCRLRWSVKRGVACRSHPSGALLCRRNRHAH